jgi:hypothetical protein
MAFGSITGQDKFIFDDSIITDEQTKAIMSDEEIIYDTTVNINESFI